MKIFLISFILNLIWELGQMGLYEPMAIYPWCCIKATFWDALMITTVILLAGSFGNILSKFFLRNNISIKRFQFVFEVSAIVLMTLFLAIYIERRALLEGRWVYSDAMPLVFGLGLSPLIQLPFTSLLSLYICDKIKS